MSQMYTDSDREQIDQINLELKLCKCCFGYKLSTCISVYMLQWIVC